MWSKPGAEMRDPYLKHRAYRPVLPTTNKLLQKRFDRSRYSVHKIRVEKATAAIDSRTPAAHLHLHLNPKKLQRDQDRQTAIEKSNQIMLQKLARIMRERTPRLDNINCYQYRSLNVEKRQRDLTDICKENQNILRRICYGTKAEYSSKLFDQQWQQTKYLMNNISCYPRISGKNISASYSMGLERTVPVANTATKSLPEVIPCTAKATTAPPPFCAIPSVEISSPSPSEVESDTETDKTESSSCSISEDLHTLDEGSESQFTASISEDEDVSGRTNAASKERRDESTPSSPESNLSANSNTSTSGNKSSKHNTSNSSNKSSNSNKSIKSNMSCNNSQSTNNSPAAASNTSTSSDTPSPTPTISSSSSSTSSASYTAEEVETLTDLPSPSTTLPSSSTPNSSLQLKIFGNSPLSSDSNSQRPGYLFSKATPTPAILPKLPIIVNNLSSLSSSSSSSITSTGSHHEKTSESSVAAMPDDEKIRKKRRTKKMPLNTRSSSSSGNGRKKLESPVKMRK